MVSLRLLREGKAHLRRWWRQYKAGGLLRAEDGETVLYCFLAGMVAGLSSLISPAMEAVEAVNERVGRLLTAGRLLSKVLQIL